MHFIKYFYEELEKQVNVLSSIDEKIDLISLTITKCRVSIHELEARAKGIDPTDIKLITKANCDNALILETLNDDRELKNEATKYVYGKCAEYICNHNKEFLQKAGCLLDHYQRMLDVKVKYHGILLTRNENDKQNDLNDRIIWRCSKEKLLKIFEILKESKIIAEYSSEEILSHFCNERGIPFAKGNGNREKIRWLKSDGSFSIFVDECAIREVIEKNNKYRIFEKHFSNKEGKSFKYLAQKKNHTINFTQTSKIIKKIFDAVLIPTIRTFTQTNTVIAEICNIVKNIS